MFGWNLKCVNFFCCSFIYWNVFVLGRRAKGNGAWVSWLRCEQRRFRHQNGSIWGDCQQWVYQHQWCMWAWQCDKLWMSHLTVLMKLLLCFEWEGSSFLTDRKRQWSTPDNRDAVQIPPFKWLCVGLRSNESTSPSVCTNVTVYRESTTLSSGKENCLKEAKSIFCFWRDLWITFEDRIERSIVQYFIFNMTRRLLLYLTFLSSSVMIPGV